MRSNYETWVQHLNKEEKEKLEELGKMRFELKDVIRDGREYVEIIDGKKLYEYALKECWCSTFYDRDEYPSRDIERIKREALEYFERRLIIKSEIKELPPIKEED